MYRVIRDFIVTLLRDSTVRLILIKLLLKAGGAKEWAVTVIVEYAFNQIAKPIIELAIQKGFLFYDTVKGQIVVKKINKAKNDKDEDEYKKQIGKV